MPINKREMVISDFDGTLTAPETVAEKYYQTYITQMAKQLGLDRKSLDHLMHAFITEIQNRPEKYGWNVNGQTVAAASSDPYVITNTAARMVINQLKREKNPNQAYQLHSPQMVDDFLQKLYHLCYPQVKIPFRPKAKEYLRILNCFTNLIIVTNSDPVVVTERIMKLLGEKVANFHVVGNAKKYLVDPNWTGMPEDKYVKGLSRPVLLRRKKYAEVIAKINHDYGQPIDAVVGDNYELDLALAESLTIPTILILNGMTPPWERAHYQDHSNGYSTESLAEVYDKLLTP